MGTMFAWRSGLAVLAAAAGAAVVMPTPGVHAEFPGHNGRIAFMRQDANDLWQLWVADGHLDDQKRLTNGPANSGWPVWSPDGTLLAFDSDEADPNRKDDNAINDIYAIKTRRLGAHADHRRQRDEQRRRMVAGRAAAGVGL
jgi:hypothetical protein